MNVRPFGIIDGQPVHEVSLRTIAGVEAKIITWGAVVRDLIVPLSSSRQQRVVLGLNSLEDYVAHSPYFGAIAGRYANRIGHGHFAIDGKIWQADLNQNARHTLHGGAKGFGKRTWQLAGYDESSVMLTLVSADGEMGFPGTLSVTCIYRLLPVGALLVELAATTNAPTIVNLAHHSYFNLDGSVDVLDHELQINADFITPVDDDLITTGEIRAVGETAYDFRSRRSIRFTIKDAELLQYDHNWVLNGPRCSNAETMKHAATLWSPKNGLAMELHTSEPGLQFYAGGKLNVPVPGLGDAYYGPNAGLALEPQLFPDSPNKPHFPDPTLQPTQVYRQLTEYRFLPGHNR